MNEFRTDYELNLKDKVSRNDLSEFVDHTQITAAKHAVGDESTLLSQFGRYIASRAPIIESSIEATEFDTLVVPVIFEHVCSIRQEIFSSGAGLFNHICNDWLFVDL